MRWGYSTGTCAAAASKAALVRLLTDKGLNQVSVLLPGGTRAEIPVARSWKCREGAAAEVVKDGGDDPDVTNGLVIAALVRLLDSSEVVIDGGKGVGKVTKPGLAVSVGKPAINPVPLEMIVNAVREILPPGKGSYITISVPEGERAALKTMNPRLGIVGGISILGTSGLVRPMSQEAYLDSLIPQIDQAIALGHRIIVLTPGGMGA
ncbi:MAG: cobalamin biosynthesis protein CbiD, partial [Syntrophomonadaceae bacterium]|nr:cobalamin biosynthesis protein CbiD [Syntrophomonadaceae bacterium]